MTDVLGFQKLNICKPHGISDVLVVKFDGDYLIGYSPKLASPFNWVKLKEGPGDFGYSFYNLEKKKYNINWNIVTNKSLDNECIGKISLFRFNTDLTPVIVDVLNVKKHDEWKKAELVFHEQFVYDFATEEYLLFESTTTTVTIINKDGEFIIEGFDPEIMYVPLQYEHDEKTNDNNENEVEDYVSLNEIVKTDEFGDVRFTILNEKIFTKLDNNNLFIELENSAGNINTDNIKQLKIIVDAYDSIRKKSEEYIIENYFNDYRIHDFFDEIFLRNNDAKNIRKISEELDKLVESPIEEKIKCIPFLKLLINCSPENRYSIKLIFHSGKGNNSSFLWFQYDDNYCFQDFSVGEGRQKR